MNPQLRNSLTAREIVPVGDYNNLPSQTEPDQCLSIKQLVERHVNGISLGVREYEPFYTDHELPNFEFMDLNELNDYKEHLNTQKRLLEDRLREQRQKDLEEAARKRSALAVVSNNTDEGGTRQAPLQPPSTTTQP